MVISHPTPVFLPGECRGQRSLAGDSPRGRESRTQLSDYHSLTLTLEFSLFPSSCLSLFSLLHFLFFSPHILVLRKATSSGQYPGIREGSECMLQLFGVSSAENTCSQPAEGISHVHVFVKQAQVQH